MRFVILLPLLLLAGCEYSYRYPCQDPANWNKLECNNEACRADGTCTSDVLGPNFFRDKQPSETAGMSPVEGNTETAESNVESETSCKPIEHKVTNHNKAEVHDPEGDEYEPPAHTPPSMDEEVPVTMNTIVDTAAHNAATK